MKVVNISNFRISVLVKIMGPLFENALNMMHQISVEPFSLVLTYAFVNSAVHLKSRIGIDGFKTNNLRVNLLI